MPVASIVRDDLIDTGYTLRHVYGLGDKCPYCSAHLQREEYGKPFTPTVGLDVCRCGFTSQQHCIA